MMGMQCPTCLRYRGGLKCDSYPQGIPEAILTGALDHSRPIGHEKAYKPVEHGMEKSESLEKAGGPMFVGPRGGKWADAAHTIPYDETGGGGGGAAGVAAPEKQGTLPGTKGEPKNPLPPGHTPREHVEIARRFLAKHKEALPATQDALKRIAGPDAKVKGRVKDVGSTLKKMIRKPKYTTADKLQDGAGHRVIHKTIAEVQETVKAIKAKYRVVAEDNYIDKPLADYRSHHLVVVNEAGLECEIQVRTENQNSFAEWSHHVYKPENARLQRAAKSQKVKAYAHAMNMYYFAMDRGKPATKPGCIKEVATSFGCL